MSFDLTASVLQVTAVGTIGALLPLIFRVRAPRPLLWYWQGLLAVLVLLPAIQLIAPGQHSVPLGTLPMLRFAAAATAGSRHWVSGRLVGFVLAAVSLLRVCWLVAGVAALGRYRSRATRVEATGAVEVRVSSDIAGPVSFGVAPPVILVPESWRTMTPEVRAAMVCHEEIHVRRHDWIFHLAEELIRSVLWFQPALWYTVAEIRSAREQVVDLEVVRSTGARQVYIDALLIAADAPRTLPLPAPCFARKHQLVQRIQSITKEYRMSKRRIALTFAGIAIVLLAGGRTAVLAFPQQNDQPGNAKTQMKIYKMKDGITPPRVLAKSDPEYTEEARDTHLEGTVLLSVVISSDGFAQDIQVLRGLGGGLNEKAVEAIQKWRFVPGMKDGEPVAVMANIEVNFRLK